MLAYSLLTAYIAKAGELLSGSGGGAFTSVAGPLGDMLDSVGGGAVFAAALGSVMCLGEEARPRSRAACLF